MCGLPFDLVLIVAWLLLDSHVGCMFGLHVGSPLYYMLIALWIACLIACWLRVYCMFVVC